MNHDPLYQLPTDLLYWGWRMQQMKSGPRKHSGGWVQFIFWRRHGLAKGDEALDPRDESLRVKVRRTTHDDAFAEAISQMRERSASLEKSEDYQRLMDEERRMMDHLRLFDESVRRPPRDDP